MARKVIDVGAVGNDGTGDSIRDSFSKVNDNFRELYSSLGLGERLTFIGLDDTPSTFLGQESAVLAVNNTTDALQFKQITGGTGVNIDTTSNANQIIVTTEFSEISGDPSPQLGGDLSAKSGGNQYRIQDLTTPITGDEAVNKAYADTKISRAGVDAIDPATNEVNGSFGTMSGPLILSRSPEPDDDERFGGLIAATKAYVDGSSFGSAVNLYVATSGSDERPGVSPQLQGRALAYAYRTIEAACKRAEELVRESQDDIGPYKKVLTYNNGNDSVTLSAIESSPTSGVGFSGTARLSVDTITLNAPGTTYRPGDIIRLDGGAGDAASYEVLTTATTPGAIVTFRQISSGNYTSTPGSINVATTSDSQFGSGATFDVTYKVNNVQVNAGGSGYSLVSVRITGGGGAGAFGVATVTSGIITKIEITDGGSGFTSEPTVFADLPRFLLRTEGQRTDFTGDVLTDTPVAYRTRDIREGLYLRGETSGALAEIVAHEGALDSLGNEIFDVDIKYGTFQLGEVIAYGDITAQIQVTIKVESGVYEENYPIKLPKNCSIVGDEFRRCIIRPRPGTSSSPWAFQKFRRDTTIDGLDTANRLYGYHYLQDTENPVYPKIQNGGNYKSSAELIRLNRNFLQNEIISWIAHQIENNIAPYTTSFEYNEALCKRDVGLILDAMIFDLKYGEYNRTVSAGLKYYQSASGRIAIGAQLSETIASINYLETLLTQIINNTTITTVYNDTFSQIVDPAFVKEAGTEAVLEDLFDAFVDVIDGSGSVNYPKDNEDMDVFLANDACRWQAITCQGHGGFMLTLDPVGQILAKSPYAQECASFSKSINAQTFAGGMFVDGFAGNLQFKHTSTVSGTGSTRIIVTGLDRFPQLPASFIVDDEIFRINFVRDFVYDKDGSSATFSLDETTPFTRPAGAQSVSHASGTPAIFTKTDHRLQQGSSIVFTTTGAMPSGLVAGKEYYVAENGLTNNTFRITETFGGTVLINTTTSGSGTLSYQRLYEILMPGNRSMLSNDFTQVADMGYGLLATNGGLTEAVSMFTYYCYVSYMSLNGAQIRSVGGSSANGVYALVADGSDPLEVPTPTSIYYELAQRVVCYAPSAAYDNSAAGLFVFVDGYDYTPLNNSELEVDHGKLIYRYPVTSVATTDLPPGVARLNLTSDETGNFEGLFAQIPDNTVMTLRSNSQILLTGELADIATRPSTGLRLQESDDVYRVLQFEDYNDAVDGRGNPQVTFTVADPTVLQFQITVTDIASNIATTDRNHGMVRGDGFTAQTTANGFVSATTYYVIDVPTYNSLEFSTTPGGSTHTLTNGSGLSIQGIIPHKQLANYRLQFGTDETLPTGITAGITYFVLEDGLASASFKISTSINGSAVAVTGAGSGTHTANADGITKTTLRENYNYNDLTIFKPGEYVGTTGASPVVKGPRTACTFTIASPGVVNSTGHGLSSGDVIRFESTGDLPIGLNDNTQYYASDVSNPNQFTVTSVPPALAASVELDFSGTATGSAEYGPVLGRAGDTTIAIVPVAPEERARIPNSIIWFNGERYIIDQYQSEDELSESYARITLNRPLVDSVIQFDGTYTLRSEVPIRSVGANGNLTIRISLTRVTSHDLLDIGTGSYADTNYPNEIFGPPVNAVNATNETQERSVGRVFYVTTDQFGNFSVGPYFRVDQGTGRVTFSAAIALSNLDGIGFKRGVPVSEFSTDSGFSDNAVDTVPTENATRLYIERRLGITHSGAIVTPAANLIPPVSGGFMSLDGQLAMKENMQLGNNKIVQVGDPTDPTDAVNLRSLTFENIQNFGFNNTEANQLIVFTGVSQEAINATVVGDISFDIDSTANTIDAQINPDTILNADINSAADIAQSKLLMQLTTADAAAPTGTAAQKQARSGLASFDTAQFTVTDGWVQLKTNGIPKTALAQVGAKSVLGNSGLATSDAADVTFATVVNSGLGVKKAQYSSTGFLRRTNASTNTSDSDYGIIDMAAGSSATVEASKLVVRDSNGDFGGRHIDVQSLKVDTKTAIDTGSLGGSSGFIRVLTYGGNGGIYLQDGTLGTDKVTYYDNDSHQFRTQNGLANAPIIAQSIQVTSLTTGGNTTAGTVTGRWTLTGSTPNESRFEATYSADVAEYYEGDKEYEVGTVLVFGGDKEVTTSNTHMDKRIAGVVSNTAAYVMYTACPGHKNLVALVGRVPCRVVGKIKKGDILVTAGIHGVAIATDDPKVGTIVGKAIEDYDSDHIGTIEIAVGRS